MDPIALTAGEIAAATGGRLVYGDAGSRIERYSIDSRTLVPGELFVALRGARFDGHRFVADAFARGASGVIVEETVAAPRREGGATPLVLHVADTTRALQDVAREVRRRSGARVVAITGSAGKTTTKEIAAEFLAARYRVFRNKGNLNNHIGLPISLLELRSRPDVAVVELGMNHPGEIRTLVGIAEPEIRIWTNVGDAHLGFFESAEAIADAKAEILEQAGPSDVLVANADDPRIMSRVSAFAGRLVTFGMHTAADVRAIEVEPRGLEGSTARVQTGAGEAVLNVPLLGLGNLANVLAATATALQFDVSIAEIVERTSRLRPATHRGELTRLPGGVTLVDDSYNSSPSALRHALEMMGAATGCARKVAVLGEMLELGVHADRLHAECGREAAAAGLDILVTVGGPPAGTMARAAVASGMSQAAVAHVPTKVDAADLAMTLVRPGDLVLVKGSRGIGTDLVVDRLKAEFA